MQTTLIPFSELLENIKDDTGITNIANLTDKIRRWVFRAEQKLGYSGAQIFKSVPFTKDQVNFGDNFLQLPSDCIEVQDIRIDDGMVNYYNWRLYGNRILFNESLTEAQTATLYYYGILHDAEGNPAVPRGHADAIIAYVMWKMFAGKAFLDSNRNSRNLTLSYRQEWYDNRDAAMGEEAFFANCEDEEIFHTIQNMSSLEAIVYRPCGPGETQPALEAKETCVLTEVELDMKAYTWQYDSLTTDISDAPNVDQSFLDAATAHDFQELREGKVIPFNKVGRIGLAIQGAGQGAYAVYDTFNSDVTDIVFDRYYNETLQTEVFISKIFYSHSNIFFKLKEL